MAGFTKLFSSITDSSIWFEPDPVRLVWITMLAMSNSRGFVEASDIGIAHRARVSLDDALSAIKKLESPDPHSRTPDNEGRRIEKVDGGWRLLNYIKYREKRNDDERREYQAELMRKRRNVSKSVSNVSKCEPPLAQAEAEAEAEAEAKKNIPPISPKGDLGVNKPKDGIEYPPDFISFWEAYPKKKAKDDAFKAWRTSKNRPPTEILLKAIENQKKSEDWDKDGGQFIPYPATWLRAGSWADEVKPRQPKVRYT